MVSIVCIGTNDDTHRISQGSANLGHTRDNAQVCNYDFTMDFLDGSGKTPVSVWSGTPGPMDPRLKCHQLFSILV